MNNEIEQNEVLNFIVFKVKLVTKLQWLKDEENDIWVKLIEIQTLSSIL